MYDLLVAVIFEVHMIVGTVNRGFVFVLPVLT